MSETVPNVHDLDIRRMVLRDHRPEEVWSLAGNLLTVHCAKCFRDWPCSSIEAARVIERGLDRLEAP